MRSPNRPDPWVELRRHASARIAIGSSGDSMPTAELLRFGVAHAQARDAVHEPLDVEALRAELSAQGLSTIDVHSAAMDRPTYIRRPDLGRRLSTASEAALQDVAVKTPEESIDVLFVVGDGLSARAVQRHAAGLLQQLIPPLKRQGFSVGPVVVARQARVALSDPIAEAFRARGVVIRIGERPGCPRPTAWARTSPGRRAPAARIPSATVFRTSDLKGCNSRRRPESWPG